MPVALASLGPLCAVWDTVVTVGTLARPCVVVANVFADASPAVVEPVDRVC